MSLQSGEWRDRIDDVDAALIDGYQSDFPITERPFRTVADDLGIEETEAIDRVRRLHEAGLFRRFGAVLNPPVIGSSTLAAVSAPPERFDDVADVINSYRQVNHNYRRSHEWNMWFVVTAGSRKKRDEIIDEIETRTGLDVLVLPMLTDFYIDLEFPVVNTDRFAGETQSTASDGQATTPRVRGSVAGAGTDASATRISEDAVADLTALDRRLLLEIQDGFPLTPTPYQDIATAVHADVTAVRSAIQSLLATGCIKRVGCVVNHVVTGFDCNCMVVWNVPDDELDARGEAAGTLPYVTLCYHRPRQPSLKWPYNLFTMIHGREASVVDEKIDELATDHLPFEHERLYSTETLKQTGARYEDLVSE